MPPHSSQVLVAEQASSAEQTWRARLPWIIGITVIAASAYLAIALWAGWSDVVKGIGQLGAPVIAIAFLLSLFNYALRFTRWQFYLRAMNHRIPLFTSLRIYLAGYALTTTPGKAGEAVRAVFLTEHGVKLNQTLAALISERVNDLLAVLLIALLGLASFDALRPYVIAALGLCAFAFSLLWLDGIRQWLIALAKKLLPPLAKLFDWLESMVAHVRACHGPIGFLFATTLSIVAWLAEAYAIHLMLVELKYAIPLTQALTVHPAGALAGALSFVPGGVGGAEAVMIVLLDQMNVQHAHSVVITIISRLSTLWFAVAIGIVAMLLCIKRKGKSR
jgi:uncharacterized protein (TIRG00374 family)